MDNSDFQKQLQSNPYRNSPSARKEQQRRQAVAARGKGGPRQRLPYVELHAASAFSFLDGASQPEDLAARAAELDLGAVALLDRGGVYGAPRFYKAAKAAGLRPLVGAEIVLETVVPPVTPHPHPLSREGERGATTQPGSRLSLLVRDAAGYRNLCRLLTASARRYPKGQARTSWDLLEAHAGGLHCLSGGDEGPLAHLLTPHRGEHTPEHADRLLGHLRTVFPGRLHVELQRHQLRSEEHRNRALLQLAERHRLPLLATNGVRYAHPKDKRLQDVLTCIRHHTQLDRAGRLLDAQRLRCLRSPADMHRAFADLPEAVFESVRLAEQLDFTLDDLGYRFPDYPLPPGETPDSYLRHLTWNGARARFRPLTARAQAQIEKELAMIERLGLAGYFLIVWDLIRFCKQEHILAQGRGSAANSAVCYALSITAVDPVKMELLFERFLSEERGEWPDIDLDLPSGAQREKVIQYVYQRYGPHGAAMTANVITYRDRSAAREVSKALGYSTEQVGRLSKILRSWSYDQRRGDKDRGAEDLDKELAGNGFEPQEPRMQLFKQLWHQIQYHPRHLGQHSGGMIIAQGRLDEVVPLEPAAMAGRTVIQWDKDDCADLGLIKVDLLGLGMLNALEEVVPLIRAHEGKHVDLAHLPPDDPKTFEMLQKADTVGVFQVESRAQMAALPRNHPERFYDLVIQVGIIRPGPIVGGMVHPYFERRRGRQKVEYPHPSLEPVLRRTLGIPLFQEQLLRIAMVAAGFSGGEAEELRRAMGFKRSVDRMVSIEKRLRAGMRQRGIPKDAEDQIVQSITSFALYGFPESHAASFALIAYASAYLKAHHPTAFLIGLLNAWPMGFYYPATLIKDAQRHGVEIRPIDVQVSGQRCRWEDNGRLGAVRLGLRFVRGLRSESALAIEQAQPFESVEDLTRRAGLRGDEVSKLAHTGALASLGLSRREALWQAARVTRDVGPLYQDEKDTAPSPLPEMNATGEMVADYEGTGLTTGDHPIRFLRGKLSKKGIVPAAVLEKMAAGQMVKVAGSVIVRQRPGTAKGVLFITVEDESGMVQAIVSPEQMQNNRKVIVGAAGLVIEGKLQRKDGSMSIQGRKFWGLEEVVSGGSHDWH